METKKMRTITLEEHYVSPGFMEGPGRYIKPPKKTGGHPENSPSLIDRLRSLDDLRISEMDAADIDIQVLSLNAPGTEQLEKAEALALSREANDFLADAIKRHPDRLLGFATLPTIAPDLASDELERMVCKYGFKGAAINGHINGRYLDDKFFWPILERAEALQVPIYLHPTPPPQSIVKTYYTGNFSQEVSYALATSGWGWHIETAVHVLRLILSGAFDRYPKLQIIIGHMGEAIPFMLSRLDDVLSRGLTNLERPISSYLRENVYYTFSGFNFTPTFIDLLLQIGVDRIMFSADYPYGSMHEARSFLDQLPVSPADKDRIAHVNAEKLFGL